MWRINPPLRLAEIRENPCYLSAVALAKAESVVKNLSIKNIKLCKTNPISERPKMVVTLVKTTNYNEQ
jgi:hypothetical protein